MKGVWKIPFSIFDIRAIQFSCILQTTLRMFLIFEMRQYQTRRVSLNSPENVLLSRHTGFFALSLMSASAPLSDLALHLMEGRRFLPAVILGLFYALVLGADTSLLGCLMVTE